MIQFIANVIIIVGLFVIQDAAGYKPPADLNNWYWWFNCLIIGLAGDGIRKIFS